jgi:hypothetical protein
MSSAPFSVPAVINVEAEVAYWRKRHEDHLLGDGSFGHYVQWIKFACDSLLKHPRASDEERETAFKDEYASKIMPRLTEDQARAFVDQCWEHLYAGSPQDLAPRPRLVAASA